MQLRITQLALMAGVGVLVGAGFVATLLFLPAPNFSPTTVTIQSGSSISTAARTLAEKDVVLHRFLVSVPLRFQGKAITAGRYKFSQAVSPVTVSNRLATGDFQTPQQQVVIPEGFTREQIADRLATKLGKDFSKQEFMQASKNLEGYLFPDTYQLSDSMTEKEIIRVMQQNFREQISKLQPDLREFSYSQEQVIIMASLIEREAADYEIRRRIAGVLWNRFDQGMPLQVDAVFTYLLDKTSAELTQEDLEIDSPYNLYENSGLPPTPIASPGLDTIRATINPIRTDDLYYLTGDNGRFYFAETLEEHNRNKRQHIGGE